MAAECSPGREPGGQVLLASTALEEGDRNFCRPCGALVYYRVIDPGLTPGATLCRLADAGSSRVLLLVPLCN